MIFFRHGSSPTALVNNYMEVKCKQVNFLAYLLRLDSHQKHARIFSFYKFIVSCDLAALITN